MKTDNILPAVAMPAAAIDSRGRRIEHRTSDVMYRRHFADPDAQISVPSTVQSHAPGHYSASPAVVNIANVCSQ